MIRTFILLSLMLFSTNYPTVSQVPYLPLETEDNPETLKILSWNIYMLPYLSLFNSNNKRAHSIAEKLNESDYHIIVFQEAFSSKCRRTLAKGLLQKYPYQYGPANKNSLPFRTNSGLWIVSKMPLSELGQIQFSLCKGLDKIARKGAVLFEGTYNNSRFQLLTTHLQAAHCHSIRDKQCIEIKEKLLNPHYNEQIPQFICGDFNIDMDDDSNYQRMLKILDASNGEVTGDLKVTYDSENNNLAYKAKGKSKIIDYVLVRNSDLIDNIERKVHTFFASFGGRESHLSDHYAMEFTINFNPMPEAMPQHASMVE